MDHWLQSAERYDVPDVYYEGDGSNKAANLRDLASDYPVADSTVPADLRTAAESLEAGYQHLDERDYGAASSAFDEVPATLDELTGVVKSDIATVEADTGWPIDLGFFDAFTTVNTRTRYDTRVENWADGDTLTTSDGAKVRLIGIDTPEMSESCSKADDALAAAEQLAPPGTKIVLKSPWPHERTDKYGRDLRFVDLTNGTDVGYSLLLSDLAQARYDSRDGYRWHVREKAYRDTGAEPGSDAVCTYEEPPLVKLAEDEDKDGPRHERHETMNAIETTLEDSGEVLDNLVTDARESHERADQRSKRRSEEGDSGSSDDSSSDGSFDFPDSLCPTRWC